MRGFGCITKRRGPGIVVLTVGYLCVAILTVVVMMRPPQLPVGLGTPGMMGPAGVAGHGGTAGSQPETHPDAPVSQPRAPPPAQHDPPDPRAPAYVEGILARHYNLSPHLRQQGSNPPAHQSATACSWVDRTVPGPPVADPPSHPLADIPSARSLSSGLDLVAPFGLAEFFGTRWEGEVYIGSTDWYQFELRANDAARVVVEDTIRNDGRTSSCMVSSHAGDPARVECHLSRGWHRFHASYCQGTGDAVFDLRARRDDGETGPILVPVDLRFRSDPALIQLPVVVGAPSS